jgi:type VI secretion system protein ImpG
MMSNELLPYYERELAFIRQMAAEFQEKYPKIARRLKLEGEKECEDPHIERMIESFALLAGRVHHKLDDELPETTEALLDALYPHYLRPIPPLAIVQFQLDPSQTAPASTQVPAGTAIHTRPDQEGQVCSFRTCYPVNLWPLRVTEASVSTSRFTSPGIPADAAGIVRIKVECLSGLTLEQLAIDRLRFYLDGDRAVVHSLYELLFLNVLNISLRTVPVGDTAAHEILPPGSLRQVGLEPAERILPYSDRSFIGYSLLQEYFAFPEKFLFFDIVGLDHFSKKRKESAFEILIALRAPEQQHRLTSLEQTINANSLQLGCTPIVNLFERIAEPIRLSQTKTEYRIVPDQHKQTSTEVYSVDRVVSTSTYMDEPKTYRPFYDLNHGRETGSQRHFWHAHRRHSLRKNDNGTEIDISLVDLDFDPAIPPVEMLSLRVTCTNRDQASRLRLAGEFGELEAEGLALLKTRCLRRPTQALRPPLRRGLQWRLISHLSLNYLSIVETGREALQEILRLYDFSDDPAIQQQIIGITAVSSRPSVSRVNSPVGVTFCRGTDVILDFDEDQYIGTGVFLLASVLHRFFGLYSAVNSFSRLTVRTKKGVLKQWPPLAGEQLLL